jgi:hypothetical protein
VLTSVVEFLQQSPRNQPTAHINVNHPHIIMSAEQTATFSPPTFATPTPCLAAVRQFSAFYAEHTHIEARPKEHAGLQIGLDN